MNRWRIVTTQNGREHVSSVVLSASEAVEYIEIEANLHRLAGWAVTPGESIVVARWGEFECVIEAREFDPLEDMRA